MSVLPILLALLLISPPGPAAALTFSEGHFECPIGGEKFSQRMASSGTQFGAMLDLKPIGPIAAPWTLAECPGNGFILFKGEFSAAELERLAPYVASPAYQALRAETTWYRAAQLRRVIDAPGIEVAYTLLNASWQASSEQYPRYAREALTEFEAAMRAPDAPHEGAAWATSEMLAGELERRLGNFDAAGRRFARLATRAELAAPQLAAIVRFQQCLIATRDGSPQLVPPPEKGASAEPPWTEDDLRSIGVKLNGKCGLKG